jgi:hypothetical protein
MTGSSAKLIPLANLGAGGRIGDLLFPDALNAATAFASVAGFLGFALVSCSYLLLLRFFLGRSARTQSSSPHQ